jgi:hypothetical protein
MFSFELEYICKKKKYVFADLRKSANKKRFCPQIENPQSVTFAEGPQI